MSGIGDLVANLAVNSAQWGSGLSRASSQLSGFHSSVASSLSGIAAMTAGIFGAGVSVAAAQDDAKAMRQLRTVLADTGFAAGITAKEIGELAAELQKTTNFSDEATVQAAAILATFKNVKTDNFKQALSLAQDLSELKGIGLTAAVTQLGKAMDSPVEAFAKLEKVGIRFSIVEKELIKDMAKAGDMAGAQAKMLQVMADTFGGVAAASVNPITQIKNALGEVAEEIGRVLLPMIKSFSSSTILFIDQWGKSIGHAVAAVMAIIVAVKAWSAAMAIASARLVLLQALSGPAGWAALAAGATAFGVAMAAIETSMSDFTEEVGVANVELKEFHAKLQDVARVAPNLGGGLKQIGDDIKSDLDVLNKINELLDKAGGKNAAADELKKIDDLFSRLKEKGPDVQRAVDFLKTDAIRNATGFKNQIAEVNDEIRILTGEATRAGIEIEKMMRGGLSEDDAKKLQEDKGISDKLIRDRDRQKQNEELAESIRESLRTPMEIFEDTKKELKRLHFLGEITDETLSRGMAKAEKDLAESDSGELDIGQQSAAALQKGSVEAASAVTTAMRQANGLENDNKKIIKNGEEANVLLADAVIELRDISRDGGIQLVAGVIG